MGLLENILFDPPSLGCVLYLPGLPGVGDIIYDRSPYSCHGTIIGATWKRLPSGLWYLDFDGTDDYVSLAKNCPTGHFTILFWANHNPTATSGWATIYEAGLECSLFCSRAITGGDNLKLRCHIGGASDYVDSNANTITKGAWAQFGVTWDGKNGQLYKNGSAINTTASGTPNNPVSTAASLSSTTFDFEGYMALTRVFTRVLSVPEISNYYQQEKHLFGVW